MPWAVVGMVVRVRSELAANLASMGKGQRIVVEGHPIRGGGRAQVMEIVPFQDKDSREG